MQYGSIISYGEMISNEGLSSLQRGMNYRIKKNYSIFLMSVRAGSPYGDEILDDGSVIIYEGHDQPKNVCEDPKKSDQKLYNKSGLTQNGLFFEAAQNYKNGKRIPEVIKVYEKIKSGIWVYNGCFSLIDSWFDESGSRGVYKFKLKIVDHGDIGEIEIEEKDLDHNRMIPSHVKLEVWKRDGGKCTTCGSTNNLHFDHILPYSKGGTSLKSDNIQLLCARHNLQKSDKIL